MKDALIDRAQITVTVGGIKFRCWRRNLLMMVRARGFIKAMGVVQGSITSTKDLEKGASDVSGEEYSEIVRGVVTAALIDPVVVPDDEQFTPPNSYHWRFIEPYADAIFEEVMKSGLDVDPSPPSSEE